MSVPQAAVVVGSGAGALTSAGELALGGVAVTVADAPEFAANLEPVARRGGIRLDCDWHGTTLAPIAATSDDPAQAVGGAELIVVSVPSFAHEIVATTLAPVLEGGQTLIWVGEGGGAPSTVAALRALGNRPDGLRVAETNTLPYRARVVAPGTVRAHRKAGGTFVAALPAADTPAVHTIAAAVWPWVAAAENVWETVLLNYNAIDHVPAIILNFGSVEGRRGPMLLWGEGATPGVARAIEAVDAELLAIRVALGLRNRDRYEDLLVAQGMAREVQPTLHETIHSATLASGVFPAGPGVVEHRYFAEDIPFALVLLASIGDEVGVDTPVIDALITLGSTVAGRDFRAAGKTLASWGLAGKGPAGLQDAADEGWW